VPYISAETSYSAFEVTVKEPINTNTEVYINKEKVGTVPVILVDKEYYAPAYLLEDYFAFAVSWDPLTSVVLIEDTVLSEDKQYSLGHNWWAVQAGNPLLLKNIPDIPIKQLTVDDVDSFSAPVLSKKGDLYLPVKFFGYIVGGQVDYFDDGIIKFSINDKILEDINYRKDYSVAKGKPFNAGAQLLTVLPYFVPTGTN